MDSFFKRLWSSRWFRCFTILAGVAAFASLVVGYVDWTGARRMEAAREMFAREGESLDMHGAAPDPAPDGQNFFAIPALKDLALCPTDPKDNGELGLKRKRLLDAGLPNFNLISSSVTPDGRGTPPSIAPGPGLGVPCDLKAWAAWLRRTGSPPAPPETAHPARDVLGALSRDDGLIHELAQGLRRPESQWTPAWRTRVLPDDPDVIAVPHYLATQSLIPMLCLRAAAAARAGDATAAHQSLLIAARLNQAYMHEPLLIGILLGCAQSAGIHGAVWELCDAHCGTADQYKALQDALTKMDYRQGFLCAERGETAGCVNFLEYLRRTRNPDIFESFPIPGADSDSTAYSIVWHLIPDGLFEENEATVGEWGLNYIIKPLRDEGLMRMLAKGKELEAIIEKNKEEPARHLDSALAWLSLTPIRGVTYKVIYTQAVENQAIAACALERYRIEHGKYPDTLAAANHPGEKPIPRDMISGKPMGYRKTPDGRYVLWCVGFSGLDHGGTRIPDLKDPAHTHFGYPTYKGDWVWSYSGN